MNNVIPARRAMLSHLWDRGKVMSSISNRNWFLFGRALATFATVRGNTPLSIQISWGVAAFSPISVEFVKTWTDSGFKVGVCYSGKMVYPDSTGKHNNNSTDPIGSWWFDYDWR